MSESFNNTSVIKIRNTLNGLHITYRSDSNPDCICERVIENKDDDLKYTLDVLYVLSDLLNLDFKDYSDYNSNKHIRLEIVEENQDCD